MEAIILTDKEIDLALQISDNRAIVNLIRVRLLSNILEADKLLNIKEEIGKEEFSKRINKIIKRIEGKEHALLEALVNLNEEKDKIREMLTN